jgi:hypothetical protein
MRKMIKNNRICAIAPQNGVQVVGGSNPLAPTNKVVENQAVSEVF